ncbi:hypothetical protein HZH68_004049 [Vespula germanica]|uniref:Uncharacterized protein n=2 Tax=Vespula TaxID=7451 RepID=A0A834NJF7_VESGE|nr:hypothetical protein HZH68_004049 [Vespula germanica]KAF7431492.1 hypothetical protein H0235_004416 [Vespula pensylvanica]
MIGICRREETRRGLARCYLGDTCSSQVSHLFRSWGRETEALPFPTTPSSRGPINFQLENGDNSYRVREGGFYGLFFTRCPTFMSALMHGHGKG